MRSRFSDFQTLLSLRGPLVCSLDIEAACHRSTRCDNMIDIHIA